ncbi:hypothetical protein [Rhodococcus sp. MALMAid1271]|uniref:hypothetical protein n=1 Tax=Rhodococcus sp. MALMAid1271 TaxID=3411744 RepID=UPI003B9DE39D
MTMTDGPTAARVLAEAGAIDATMPKPDAAIATTWAATLSKYNLPIDVMLEAVREHYADETRRILPADVTRIGRKIRQARGDQESEAERDARALRNDARLGLEPSIQIGPRELNGAPRNVKALIASLADSKRVAPLTDFEREQAKK